MKKNRHMQSASNRSFPLGLSGFSDLFRLKPIVFSFCVVSTSGSWACSLPPEPTLPSADTAVIAEMIKAQKDVKKYMAEANAFLECVKSDVTHNKTLDRMKEIAAEFNGIAASYKARKKAEKK